MKATGIVLSVKENQAYVRVCRESACAACKGCAGGGCHAEFMLSEAPASYELYADNPPGAGVGDTVEFSCENRVPLTLAFILFVMPLVLAVAAYFAGAYFAGATAAVLSAGIAFFIFFFAFAFIANRLCAGRTKPTICKIIKESGK